MQSAAPRKIRTFQLDGRFVTFVEGVPDHYQAMAQVTYNSAADGRDLPLSRVEEMVSVCFAILDSAEADEYPLPPRFSDSDSEAEKINDVLSLGVDGSVKPWQTQLSNGEKVWVSEMLFAYALHKLDVAASLHLQGKKDAAILEITLAYEAVAKAGFHYGYLARTSDYRVEGMFAGKRTPAARASANLRDYALKRWHEGDPNGNPWKSARTCALSIEDDVKRESARLKFPLVGGDTWRTIYGWLRAEGVAKKRKP